MTVVPKLTRKQQDVLDALNFMDEDGLLPAGAAVIARRMGLKNGVPDLAGPIKRLESFGLIVRDFSTKQYSLAPDPDAGEIVEGEG